MTTLIDEPQNTFKLDMQKVSRDFFIFSTWFGNIFINTKDFNIKSEEMK